MVQGPVQQVRSTLHHHHRPTSNPAESTEQGKTYLRLIIRIHRWLRVRQTLITIPDLKLSIKHHTGTTRKDIGLDICPFRLLQQHLIPLDIDLEIDFLPQSMNRGDRVDQTVWRDILEDGAYEVAVGDVGAVVDYVGEAVEVGVEVEHVEGCVWELLGEEANNVVAEEAAAADDEDFAVGEEGGHFVLDGGWCWGWEFGLGKGSGDILSWKVGD